MPYAVNERAVRRPAPDFPPLEPLRGRWVTLEPLADGLFDDLYHCSHGAEECLLVWRYMPYGPFADAGAMRECYSALPVNGDPQFFAVRHHDDGGVAGIVSYLRIFPSAYTIEIGHIWHAVERQRGTATTETAFLLIECAFQLGYRRVEWKCNAANERSRRAALRLGFSFEGVFRQQNVFKKRNRDTAWFAVLDDDWPAIRSNFLRWFDSPASSLSGMNRPHVDWSLAAHDAWPPPAQT